MEHDVLAVTICPNDHYQYFCHQKRYESFYKHFSEQLETLLPSKYFHYQFSIELSEPIGQTIDSKGPRLHLHGTIVLHKKLSVFKWLLDVMPHLLADSILSIKHIPDQENLNKWYIYCDKQLNYMPKNLITNSTISYRFPSLVCAASERGTKLEPTMADPGIAGSEPVKF